LTNGQYWRYVLDLLYQKLGFLPEETMTLIAGFKLDETPILVGDLVLSVGNARSSAMKKIVKLSDNCVLGWSGNRKIAEEVFFQIRTRFKMKDFTYENIYKFLINLKHKPDSSLFATIFIGWVVKNEKPICFLWRTDYPSEVFPQEGPIKAGSGSPWFADDTSLENLSEVIRGRRKEADRFPGYLPGLAAVGALGVLMRYEFVKFGNMNDKTFGMSYEILYYNGNAFKYLTDVSYFAVLVELELFDDRGTCKSMNLIHPRIKTRSNSYFTEVIQLPSLENNRTNCTAIHGPGLTNIEYNRLIKKANKRFKSKLPSKSTQVSDFYCTIFILRDSSNGNFISNLIFAECHGSNPDEESCIQSIDEETCKFKIPHKYITQECMKYKKIHK
jgi:hypothetical protein